MGIAEIQAALAANRSNGPAANPFAAQPAAFAPAPPAPPAPSPFAAPTAVANPFGGPAPAPVFQPLPAPLPPAPAPAPPQAAPTAFAFNPPPGFNPASTPPINPPGERASLNSVVAAEVPAAPAAPAPPFTPPSAPAEPKRRGRKPKAETLLEAVAESPSVPMHRQAAAEQALASHAEIVLSSISTEDLVALLRDRGYTVILESKA